KISTNADFEDGSHEVVAGAKIVDKVTYEGLVPGKEYILDAQLISKEDGKTVLGETKGHKFTPDEANGTEAVTITVNDDVTEPVEAAVAFETLTSTQVDKHGEDNPTDEDNPNPVGEHKDINDKDQTVPKGDKPSETTTPETATSTEEVPDKPGHGGEGETSTPSSSEDSSTSTTSETSESEEPSESESSEPSESESVETTSSEASETSESDKPSDGESTTPDKPTEPSESTEPNEPGTPGDDEKDTPKVSTNADFEGGL
ncbi:VaFE repeat-containing surface-anchored protein, partial [Campylobacter jejuni]